MIVIVCFWSNPKKSEKEFVKINSLMLNYSKKLIILVLKWPGKQHRAIIKTKLLSPRLHMNKNDVYTIRQTGMKRSISFEKKNLNFVSAPFEK